MMINQHHKNSKSSHAVLAAVLLAVLSTSCSSTGCTAQSQNLKLVVHGQFKGLPMGHFWQSTGFCPPLPHQSAEAFDLSPDMVQNLAYIGAVPHRGIQQVRIHWLLDLVKVQSFLSGQPVYNFTALDQMIDLLHVNGLRPGFELMGSPSSIFTDMENKTQVYWWRDLVIQVSQRYIDRYGLGYVKKWNFETWNEPDCHDFDDTKMTVQGFLNYYDACSEGLKAASSLLVFGGPGDGCDLILREKPNAARSSKYREALFHHVVNGTNYFTGQKGVRLDFISLHRKGSGTAVKIIDDELKSMSSISRRFPQLSHKPFYNDEADPLVGWSKDKRWRATAAYAAMVVKMNVTSTSTNDSSHGERTFAKDVVHWQSSERGKKVKYVTFIRKPVFTAMVLLAKLGDRQVFSEMLVQETKQPLPNDSYAGAVATVHIPTDTARNTSDSLQWATIVYSSSDTSFPTQRGKLDFEWWISAVNATDLMLAVYAISEKMSNPYLWWHDTFGKPDFPSLEQFEIIRKNEGPYLYSLAAVSSDEKGVVDIPPMDLLEPHVLLLHLCKKSPSPPEQVTGLRMVNITAGQVLILWSDSNIHTKCIQTFVVEQYKEEAGTFQRINTEDTIVNLFVHATDSERLVQGKYRVRAIDYWQRAGPYSTVVSYTHTHKT